ncbi:MAG: hypothetical protein GX575_19700 [Candidatus Anammoximicrobium sp.]|nr:hypothetical protein [Candidatus Anammoximicrobium sp.]
MNLQLDHSDLLKTWELMHARNAALGPARFDFGDIASHPLFLRASRGRWSRLAVKAMRSPELLFPITYRQLLGLSKQVVPSLFYHLGLTCCDRERLPAASPDAVAQTEAAALAALDLRAEAEHVCWKHPYDHHAAAWRTASPDDRPPSCAHHTGRVGLMLLRVGRAHRRADFVAAGGSAAKALLEYHNWHAYDDGTYTVSYYPSSQDEVINTGADAAVLLAALEADQREPWMQDRLEGLVRMLVAEQHADGSWDYCTRRHYQTFGGQRAIDNHHSAMNLAALARILAWDVLEPELGGEVGECLEKGLRFYLDAFFTADGSGSYFPGGGRPACVVGYCEGVSALCAALSDPRRLSAGLADQADRLLPRILARTIDEFFDPATGDVACERWFGRRYRIQSARWGSAPLMQAITDYLTLTTGRRGEVPVCAPHAGECVLSPAGRR